MTYEELLINIELNGYKNVLPIVGNKCLDYKYWFVVCDDGDCHLFSKNGRENDISKVKKIYEYMIPTDIKKIVIPDNVLSIDDMAFYNCNELMSVAISNNVMTIGELVFKYCNNLKSLIFKGKSFDQIRSMKNYPFGIENKSIIRCN